MLRTTSVTVISPRNRTDWFSPGKVNVFSATHPMGVALVTGCVKHLIQLHTHTLVVMLIPARTDTRWFHDYIYQKHEVRFIRGRLKFGDSKNPAPFPSMVVVFRSELDTGDAD